MENICKISSIIDSYISGDWGNDCTTDDTPYPVYCVRGADIVPISNSQFNDIPLRYVSKRSFQTRCLQEGDIIIEKSGGSPTQSTGRVVYVSKELLSAKKNIVCSNFCTAFRVKEGWNAHYIFLYLQNVYNSGVFFNFEGKTSGLKNLMMDAAFKSIPIKKIPIAKQTDLADSISAIDKKLSLNRQINDNLEAMAKQLYEYWFVQFDFPNEEGKPYKSSGGAMVWNEKLKREIPQGWSVLSVNDIAASVRGVSYAKDDMVDSNNGVLVLRGNNIQDNHLIYDSNVAYIPSSFVSENQRIRPLDIIMTMSSGSKEHIGKSAMFQFASEDTFGAFLTKFTAKEHCAYLLFNLFNSKYFKAKIKSIACGTGINNLTNQTFDEIYVVMPEDELLLEFDKRQSQIFAEIGLIEKSNIELTRQQDELLPLLMNGQATVNYHLSAY